MGRQYLQPELMQLIVTDRVQTEFVYGVSKQQETKEKVLGLTRGYSQLSMQNCRL